MIEIVWQQFSVSIPTDQLIKSSKCEPSYPAVKTEKILFYMKTPFS